MSRSGMKPRLPRGPIQILGRPYTITYLHGDEAMDLFAQYQAKREDVDGFVIPSEHRIVINLDREPLVIQEALAHEILEAMNAELDLKLSHNRIQTLSRGFVMAGFELRGK